MKKILSLLFFLPLILACDKDSNTRNVNPYLPQYSFSVSINTSLPQYSGLTSPINPVFVDVEGAGVSGLIVMKISDTDYRAWEAACPNQYPTSCSRMSIKNNTTAKCSCEDFEYSLLTGVGAGGYTMIPYRYEIQGSVVRIFN